MAYLTGPVNTLTDFQVEYAGLLMGPNTPFGLPPHQLLDMATVKKMDTARIGRDGSWSGPHYADFLAFTLDIEVYGSPQTVFDAAAAALEAVMFPQLTPMPFWYKLPNRPPRGIGVRPTKRHLPVDITWERGLSIASAEFEAPDPRWQSVPRTVTIAAGTAQRGGLVFPLFKRLSGANGKLDFGSTGASSSQTLTNAGNSDAWPYVTVTPPAAGLSGFSITVAGHTVTYSGTVGNGQQVVLDAFAGTAGLINAGDPTSLADRTYLLTARDWAPIPARSSAVLAFYAAGGTAAATIADMWR
ncbi:MAG: hypothetical protein HIU88_10265 [Acidobacteria bacterium]|nr:hypothetical protein [Acidobacteriota bacterium]